ncbi:MAG: type II toxin-antitoxin system HicB family antitoxin [Methylococcales bacterium]|nr:type II toxin-antitoxin system HicB family antitoxin [Methylococcales bacterium]
MPKKLTAIIHKEDDIYVSLCPELDIASQGSTIEEAKDNLKEAVELFFECASEKEISDKFDYTEWQRLLWQQESVESLSVKAQKAWNSNEN